jgi:serine/threonine-protein kinase
MDHQGTFENNLPETAGETSSAQRSKVPPECIRAELERVLTSKPFAHSARLSRFLRFTVERAAEGEGDQLKEYVLGLRVFDRDESFDPRIDPIVRVEAHRLRTKLKLYYGAEGVTNPLRIEFPKGGYAPAFIPRTPPDSPEPTLAVSRHRRLFFVAGAAAAGAVFVFGVLRLAETSPRVPAAGKGAPEAASPSLAVLPFADLSPESDEEYFCDGLTDEIINALAQVEGLRVVSRTSSFQFKGKANDVRKIGEQLNVDTVLEGSVRKSGGKLRINVQLVKAADGYQVWSAAYDREVKEIFAIQEEISKSIVSAMRLRLAGDGARFVRAQPRNLEAYHLYLRGRYHWNKRTEQGLKKSIEHFEQAIGVEPDWGTAHAALAESHALLASYGVVRPHEAMPQARRAAEKALSIDQNLASAHAALGFVRSFYDWDWPGAEAEYRKAIELNAGYATAHQWYSGFLRAMGRLREALEEARRAQSLDPLSLATGRDTGRIFYSGRQYDRAIEHYRKVLELDPNFPSAYLHLGMAYGEKGLRTKALAAFQKARELPGANPLVLAALGYGYALAGRPPDAQALLDEIDALSRVRHVAPVTRALVHIGLRENRRALEWLETACRDRDPWLIWLQADPVFDPLRGDPGFEAILARMRFPTAPRQAL